jgi:hypothetical protein
MSNGELNEEVEQPTLVVRRSEQVRKIIESYIPPNLCFSFVLTSINEESKSVRESLDLVVGKLW